MEDAIIMDQQYYIQVYQGEPIIFESGEEVFLKDVSGKYYLDFSAHFSACSLGHNCRELLDALKSQMDRLICVSPMFITEERIRLAETLAGLAPPGLSKSLFGCTGSDANEFALKTAKYYRGGGKIISFWRGYHGATAGAAGATGKAETIQLNPSIAELLPRGFIHASPPYCYRCDFQKQYPECDLFCLKFLETQIHHEAEANLAAVITEPVFAAGGVIVPPAGYLEELKQICRKYGALLIFDEVVTGIGRTGKMFACERWKVSPDILVSGKALTGGYIPGSAVMVREDIGKLLDQIVLHGHTHSGYPLMCCSANKNLEIIIRDQLCEKADLVGEYLRGKLLALQEEFDVIGDVRGVGLLQGIELVKDKASREPDYDLGEAVFKELLRQGLIVELESRKNLNNCVLVLHPPLITGKAHVDQAVDIMRNSFRVCLKKMSR